MENEDNPEELAKETERLVNLVKGYWNTYVTSTSFLDVAAPNVFYSESDQAVMMNGVETSHAVGFYLFLNSF